MQLVDEGIPSEVNKDFAWTLGMPDPFTLLITLAFDDPNAISSNSNDLDKLRITFVETSQFVRCETAQEEALGRNM